MAIPAYSKILRPVLEFLARHQDQALHVTRDLMPSIAEQFNLTEEEKNYRHPSGGLKLRNFTSWACLDLNKAGLIEKPKRGYVRITQSGQDYLNRYPGGISQTDLRNNCPKYKQWLESRKKSKSGSDLQDTKDSDSSAEETSEARIDDARQEIHPILKEEKECIVAPPTYPKILRSVLEFLARHRDQELNITRNLVPAIAEQFNLTEEEKNFRHPTGALKLRTSIIQAGIDLNKSGLIEKPAPGYFRITQAGQDYLNRYPGEISKADLRNNCPEYKKWEEIWKKPKPGNDLQDTKDSDSGVEETPEERIEDARQEIHSVLKEELLEAIMKQTPVFFKQLIIKLLQTMGYGDEDKLAKNVEQAGDGGISGIIYQDALGLDVVYLQAKRYEAGNHIRVGMMRDFIGSLDIKNANKGVFMTTSDYNGNAKATAEKAPQNIVVINGRDLVEYMIKYKIGVRTDQTIELCKIDNDFFEE